jgi:hypothetical protein
MASPNFANRSPFPRPILSYLTVEENTPIEQADPLDPELSGKVFKNLLAAFRKPARLPASRPARSSPAR